MSKRRRNYVNVSNVEVDLIDDDFDELMHAFLREQRLKKLSKYTIEYYQRELTKFMHTIEKFGYTTRLRRLNDHLIRDVFVKYMYEKRNAKHATVDATMRALKAFLNWAVGKGVIESSPLVNIDIGKPRPRQIETFTREQIREILKQPDLKMFVGLRDYTIMLTLLETGVRVRELTDIKINDVRFEDSQILIDGKNGENRLVPFQTQTARVLKHYIKARGRSESPYLFITVDDAQMNRATVRSRINKYGRMANITNVRCSPHTFRHTFAKMSVKNGADIFTLQKILGHSSLDMVRVYVNMFSQDVKDAHERFSPVENLIRL